MTKISFVLPFYNEEKLVQEFFNSLTFSIDNAFGTTLNFEYVAIDDGSSDGTYDILRKIKVDNKYQIKIIRFTRNFGLEAAILAGLRHSTGDAVITMDTDMQDPPSVAVDLIREWQSGHEVVLAKRASRSDTFFKKYTAKYFYKLLDSYSGKIKYEGDVANFRLHSRRVINTILKLPESNTVYRVLSQYVGFKYKVIDYHRDERFSGETKFNLKKMLAFSIETMVSSSVQPLSLIGSAFLVVLVFIITFPMISIGLFDMNTASVLIIEIVAALFLFILGSLAIMAAYVGQILIEVKRRPEYILDIAE